MIAFPRNGNVIVAFLTVQGTALRFSVRLEKHYMVMWAL